MSEEILNEQLIQDKFSELLNSNDNFRKPENIERITRAFNFANKAHRGMKRKSGEPFIIHPLEVAIITSKEIGLGTTSIISALLHDAVEDTHHTIEEMQTEFGDISATIIDGLTKIEDVYFDKQHLQVVNFKKLLQTIPEDLRIIFVKLADRLHNMRTMDSMPTHKQQKKSSETLYVYAPLAHRLGLFKIKSELEDLSFKYLEPENYKKINEIINKGYETRNNTFNSFKESVRILLDKSQIDFEIYTKTKSVYSTWKTMRRKRVSFDEIYNFSSVDIVFNGLEPANERSESYRIYEIITSQYHGQPNTMKDWITNPRSNGYEALHFTVIGTNGEIIEIHVLSKRMYNISQRGYAIGKRYIEKDIKDSPFGKWISLISEQLNDPEANIEDLFPSLSPSDIYVYTPKGEIYTLPTNATVLDFAFEIHTELGMKCAGGKVNHKLVPRNYKLNSGDQVKVLTDSTQTPDPHWLDFVNTTRAKAKLRKLFRNQEKSFCEKGKTLLDGFLNKHNLQYSNEIAQKISSKFFFENKTQLFCMIGRKEITDYDLTKTIKPHRFSIQRIFGIKINDKPTEVKIDPKAPLIIDTSRETNYILSKCCNPIPGDEAIAYKRPEDGLLILHSKDCNKTIELRAKHADFVSDVKWLLSNKKDSDSVVRIRIEGYDRRKLANDITKVVSEDLDKDIHSIVIQQNDSVFEGTIDVYVKDTEDLENIKSGLKRIKGIKTVERIDT